MACDFIANAMKSVMIATQAMRLRRYDANAVMSLTALEVRNSNHIITFAKQIHNARSAYNFN